jgi:molybdopterin converting factor small subunit
MPVNLLVPPLIARLIGGKDTIQLEGGTVGEVMDDLNRAFPDLKEHLYDLEGNLKSFYKIYVNGNDILFHNQMETEVLEGDEVFILTPVAGGSE